MNTLYVVATPVGNMGDISQRALEVLKNAKLIITENQDTTRKLFNLLDLNIRGKELFTFADFSKEKDIDQAIKLIKRFPNSCLVSEAGTPLISDPGYKLISSIRNKGLDINIVAVPGPSSLTAHLSISGLPTDKFLFLGFLPKTKSKRENIIKNLSKINKIIKATYVIFESKYKIKDTLELIRKYHPSAKLSVGNDLTKMFESVYYGNVNTVIEKINGTKTKGEFILHIELES